MVFAMFQLLVPAMVFLLLSLGQLTAGQSDTKWTDIKTFYALGDSYAAGLMDGAKQVDPDGLCNRFEGAYPFHMSDDPRLSEASFANFACSNARQGGYKEKHLILSTQYEDIEAGNADLITLTIGGNENDAFFKFLCDCIYGWFDGLMGKSNNCVDTLPQHEQVLLMLPPLFNKTFVDLVNKLSPTGHLLVTGYASFFNSETTLCNDATFHFWKTGLWPSEPKWYLSEQKRSGSNMLIKKLNKIIKENCELFAPQCVYVDIDTPFEEAKGRFCEEGVHEPDSHRKETLFYTGDDEQPMLASRAFNPQLANVRSLDTSLKQVFHPRMAGQILIAQTAMRTLESVRNGTYLNGSSITNSSRTL